MTHEGRSDTVGVERRLSPREMDRFEAIVLPYLDAAYNLARYLMRDPHEAEDAVQEACLRAVRHFQGFRGVDGRAWLLSIVRNTCLTLLGRRRSGREVVEFEEQVHSVKPETPAPEADLARTIAVEKVQAELARLPIEFREVLVLREMEGHSYKEIAQITGTPIGTVMSRLARARKQLSAALAIEPKESA